MFGDDEEFIPGPSSNLASLFDKRLMEDGNLSLMYKAPKQPKAPVQSSKPSTAPSNLVDLILFKSVEAYKLENGTGTYQTYGKTVVAVLANEETRLYQILLYRDKLHHLCSAKINLQFKFLNQANNYATFFDKQNHVWSVLFATHEDAVQFSVQVALAKFNSEEKACLLSQDLWLPVDDDKGTVGSVGDTVEFQYTVYDQEQLNKLSQRNKTGTMCAKIDTSGWQQELQNICKGTQRLLIIPSVNLGDWKSVVPSCSVLFVRLTVLKVINALTEVMQLPQIKEKPLKTVQLDNAEHNNGEETVKARGASIKDALSSSPKTAKASLISRMARMGQATLPVSGTTATPSDSDETEEDQCIGKTQVDTRPDLKPRIHNNQSLVQSMPPSAALRNSPQTPWQPYTMGPMYTQVISSPSDPSFSVFFSEVRTHNSELRMGITRVSDKVDSVLSKLDGRTDKTGNDEALLSCVDKLLQENSSFKKRLEENCQQFCDQNREILKILSRLKPSDAVTCTPSDEEVTRKELSSLLAASQSDLSSVKEQLSEQQKINEGLQFKLKCMNEELDRVVTLNEIEHNKELSADENEVLILKESHEKQIAEINGCLRKAETEALTLKENQEKEIVKLMLALQNQEEIMNKMKEENEAYFSAKQELENVLLQKNTDVKELEKVLLQKNTDVKELEKVLLQKNTEVKELEKILLQKNTDVKEMEISLQKHEAIIEELKSHLVQEKSKTDSSEEIKTVMNIAYKYLKAQFQQDVTYDAASIQTVLVDTIKTVTYQYLHADSMLRGNLSKREKKSTVNPNSSETKITSTDQHESEEKSVESEPRLQQDNSNTQCESVLPGENKYNTEEEREQMKFSLEPKSSHSSTGKKISLEATKSNSSTDEIVSSVEEHNVPPMPIEPSVLPTVSEKGDFEINSKKNEVSTENVVKPSRGPLGDDEDSADDIWRPQPPPPPNFDEDDNEDDWFNT